MGPGSWHPADDATSAAAVHLSQCTAARAGAVEQTAAAPRAKDGARARGWFHRAFTGGSSHFAILPAPGTGGSIATANLRGVGRG